MKQKFKSYKGFNIPLHLIKKTGGTADTWEGIIKNHFRAYDRLIPIFEGMTIVEVGCGVARDAIPMYEKIGPEGRYVGIDVIKESIEWCSRNVSRKWKNFSFFHFNAYSQGYNPSGNLQTTDIVIPCEDDSVDLCLLQSVFTHLRKYEILHYLAEFQRVLNSTGRIFTTAFVVDKIRLKKVQNRTDRHLRQSKLKFPHKLEDGFYTNDINCPDRAIAIPIEILEKLLFENGLKLAKPIDFGYWAGDSAHHAQDILVLEKA